MRPKTSRLLLVLVSTMLGACAGQTERSSTGGAPKTLASEPVSYVDPPPRRTEPATAPPEPAAAPSKPPEEPEIRAEGEPADMVPVPSPDSFEPDADDRKISDPVMTYDEEGGAPQEETIVAQNQYYDEEERPAEDDGIVSQNQYSEEEAGAAPEEGIVAESQYYDEEESVAATDDGIVAQNQYFDEENVETDDGIVAQNQYYDEESIETDDGIVSRNEFYDEETVETGDGIVASRQYYDEEDVIESDDGIVARNEFFEEENRESPELIGEPKSYPEETVVAAAEEKQAEPAPKPVVLPITVTLQAETLFAFDRYAVQAETHATLDKLASGLQGVRYDAVVIVGHADRIGTQAYNQQLSLRRAEAVKQYLISKGVAANTIKTEGRGELDPALDPSTCQGKRKQKLIACLQPDRRVDVTVTGQKQPK